MADDNVQHGIDDDPHDDGKKALGLGALGGGAVGAIAGMAAGPIGAIIGAAIGGTVASLASGAAVDAVDAIDNDDTVTGLGDGATGDVENVGVSGLDSGPLSSDYASSGTTGDTLTGGADVGGHNIVTGEQATTGAGETGLGTGAIAGGLLGAAVGGPVGAVVGGTAGSLLGGVAGDAAEAADRRDVGASRTDDLTLGTSTGMGTTGATYGTSGLGNDVPGVQTGGMTTQGSDTRGITEKIADAVTGDRTDDKTGGMTSGMMGTGMNTDVTGSSMTGMGATTAGLGAMAAGTSTSSTDLTDGDRIRVPVMEEELNVSKSEHEAGEVEISKRVIEEQVSVPVQVAHEEVTVTRHAVDRPLAPGETVLQDGETIRVPVMEETVAVSKDARVVEEVEINKERLVETQNVTDTVRREEVVVNDPTITGTTGTSGTSI